MTDTDKRNLAKARIVNYIMAQQSTSKVEVSRSLGISMPTVLSNARDLRLDKDREYGIGRSDFAIGESVCYDGSLQGCKER